MNWKLWIGLAMGVCLFAMRPLQTAEAGQPKVTVCHVEPDSEEPGAHVISIAVSAVPGHLAHGDNVIEVGEEEEAPEAGTPCTPTEPEPEP